MGSFAPGMKAGSGKPAPPPAPVVPRAEPVHRAPPKPAVQVPDAIREIVADFGRTRHLGKENARKSPDPRIDGKFTSSGLAYDMWVQAREWLEKMK